MAGPYNELGNLMRNLEKNRKKKISQFEKSKAPQPMKLMNEIGYINENGLDRQDAAHYHRDREGFRKKVNDFAENNGMRYIKETGKVPKNFGLIRAAQRGEKKKKEGSKK